MAKSSQTKGSWSADLRRSSVEKYIHKDFDKLKTHEAPHPQDRSSASAPLLQDRTLMTHEGLLLRLVLYWVLPPAIGHALVFVIVALGSIVCCFLHLLVIVVHVVGIASSC